MTLTTEQVRRMIGVAPVEALRDWRAEFDRWYVLEFARTWDEGYNTRLGDEFDNGGTRDERTPNPYKGE